ncbi:hypothetical protein [Portibacter lacus]|uniref:Uncharacterized protein n=1 Tax=Portibacter lacus TaxID=1099794 RepID=A0AA37WBX0_9BACT|nr:hypothetical protein [Portibacter lacus]GLR15836.1 hypothetical protein GCM10007940_04510 [Portibacter lacus]
MSTLDQVRFIIYRCHEKGLEIFLVNSNLENDPDVWNIPQGDLISQKLNVDPEHIIELDPFEDEFGNVSRAYAIEGDWHDIPSIRGMIKHDIKLVKSKVKEILPDSEKGTYFAMKEAFKKVLPVEYAALKELKDIIVDRNMLRNL